jgi:hypothetical protein
VAIIPHRIDKVSSFTEKKAQSDREIAEHHMRVGDITRSSSCARNLKLKEDFWVDMTSRMEERVVGGRSRH